MIHFGASTKVQFVVDKTPLVPPITYEKQLLHYLADNPISELGLVDPKKAWLLGKKHSAGSLNGTLITNSHWEQSSDAIDAWVSGGYKNVDLQISHDVEKKLVEEGQGTLTVYANAHGDIYKATYKGPDQSQT
jgi:hypothetical protein